VKSKFAMAGLLSVSLVLSGSLAYAQGPAEYVTKPIDKMTPKERPITMPPRPVAIGVKDCLNKGGTIELASKCASGSVCKKVEKDGPWYQCVTGL
jgi:hypothetical protein